MRAFKVLVDGRSPFSGWEWPLPHGGAPGEWVRALDDEPLALCVNGVHACTVGQLPQWLGEELWEIELEGEILTADAALVAQRGPLVRPVDRWDPAARGAFAADCAERARPRAEGFDGGHELLAIVERFVGGGRAGPAGYWSAVIAGERVARRRDGPEYDAEFARERAAPSDWLARALRD